MRHHKLIEELLLQVTAGIAVLLDLGDTFDWFHLFPNNSSALLTLLLCALMLATLAALQRQLKEVRERLQRLQPHEILNSLDTLTQHIDSGLVGVLNKDYFQGVIDFLCTAIKDQKVPIEDFTRFCYYCVRMLRTYRRATYLITCSYKACYPWEDASLEQATNWFLQSRGKLKIVLIASNRQELATPMLPTYLKHLQQSGIQYYLVDGTSIPADLKKYFIVESRGRIAWDLTLDSSGHVKEGTLTTDKQTTMFYVRTFNKLWDHELRKKRH